jgi:DNA-binding winged helix-turn-helix (wHTH) protein
VLAVMPSSAGSMVPRETFRNDLWGSETFVDFEALGDDARKPEFIEALSRRGYRFVATVEAA